MGRFRKLTLEESREEFELINESTCKSLKGGAVRLSFGIQEQESGIGMYSLKEINFFTEEDTFSALPMSSGSNPNGNTIFDDVYCYGYTPRPVDYGTYCMEHRIYFPRDKDCYECFYDGDREGYQGGNYYSSDYYGKDYNASGGDNLFPGFGGGSSGGSGGGTNSSSSIKFVYSEENQRFNTCATMCITQILLTYGDKDATIQSVLDKAAKAINDDPENCHSKYKNMTVDQIRRDIWEYGIEAIDIKRVLKSFFETSEIVKAFPGSPESKDPDSLGSNEMASLRVNKALENGNVVMAYYRNGEGGLHCIAITKMEGNKVTYYDPMDTVASKNGEKTFSFKNVDLKLFEVAKKEKK